MITTEVPGCTVVHWNVTEYPLTGSKVLLTVAVTLPGTISPGFTVAESGLTASAMIIAAISGKMGLHQPDSDPGNMVRTDVITKLSFFA